MACATNYLPETQGRFQAVNADLVKLFGKARQGDQSAGEARIRLVKDVIRVGKWKVGPGQYEEFTPERLTEIERCFHEAKSRGYTFNLCKTHGFLGQVHPDDLMAVIDDVKFDGKTLWATVYVTPEQKQYLSNPAMKTSPGFFKGWVDGQGHKYGCQMVHLAVTDTPVVSGQGQFIALSNEQGTEMDFAALVEVLNGLMEKLGLPKLPEELTPETLVDSLKTIAESVAKEDDGECEDCGGQKSEGEVAMLANAQEQKLASMLDLIEKAIDRIGDIDTRLVTMSNEQTEMKKNRYADRVAELLNEGRITSGQRDSLVRDGESVQWNLSNLQEFATRPAIYRQNRVSSGLATEGEPPTEGVSKTLTPERIAELAARLMGKK